MGYIGTLSAVDLVLVCLLTIPRHASPVFGKCGLKSAMSEKRDAHFTARRYVYVRSWLSSGVRMSVRPSLCLSRLCIVSRRMKISSNFFLGSVALVFSFFLIPSTGTQCQGDSFIGGTEYRGLGKFAVFDWNRRFSLNRYEIGPWLVRNGTRKS